MVPRGFNARLLTWHLCVCCDSIINRQNETELLLERVTKLESRAQKLWQRAEGRLSEKQVVNAILREAHRGQQISFVVAQSAVSGTLVRLTKYPFLCWTSILGLT